MHVRITLAAAVGAAVLGMTAGAVPALADAPDNDVVSRATEISALPYDDQVDTSEATTDADDAALNADCGAPVTNGSVWYTFVAPAGVDGLVIDVNASSFSAGAIIAESDGAGGWVVVSCGPGATGTFVTPGSTYRVLAFSDNPSVTGGTLRLHAEEAVVPTVTATINPRGKVDRNGNALLSGTFTCTGADFLELGTSLVQPVGRFAIQGDGYTSSAGTCDGQPHAWSTVVVPYNGKFAGGKAASVTFAFGCGSVFCADSYLEQRVRLSR